MSTFSLDSAKLNEAISSVQNCARELTELRSRVVTENRRLIGQKGFRIQTTNGELSAFLRQIDNQIHNVNQTVNLLNRVNEFAATANRNAERILDEKNAVDSIVDILQQVQRQGQRVQEGISSTVSLGKEIMALLGIPDESDLGKLLNDLKESGKVDSLIRFGFASDGKKIFDAYEREGILGLLNAVRDYGEDTLVSVLKSCGFDPVTAKFVGGMLYKSADNLGENIVEIGQNGLSLSSGIRIVSDMTLGALLEQSKEFVEEGYNKAHGIVKGIAGVFGFECLDANTSKQQMMNLVREVEVGLFGENNVEYVENVFKKSFSYNHAVSEICDAIDSIFGGKKQNVALGSGGGFR